jgi:transposase
MFAAPGTVREGRVGVSRSSWGVTVTPFTEGTMDQLIARCAGLDVHQATVVACVLLEDGKRGAPKKQVKTFATVGRELRALREWLAGLGVTHVAMEGTGVYWRPVHAVLEGHFDLTIANAKHIQNVPGRKTDVSDSEWIANLLRHGLIRKSFIPQKEVRALRDLTRYRRMLVQSHAQERNRIIKVLETAGIKLAGVASDVFGRSGMEMLAAIVEGKSTPEQMAELARGRLRSKRHELMLALDVGVEEHHRLMLAQQLRRLASTDKEISELVELIRAKAAPYVESLELLRSIVGFGEIVAIEILAEVGPDLSSFPSERHFASWAGLCPGAHESGGKRKDARRRRGNPYIQAILVEAAYAASRKKGSYFKDKFYRLKARRGGLRALFAIAHKLGCAAYRVLTTKTPFKDLGDMYLDRRDPERIARQLVGRLLSLGYSSESVQQMIRLEAMTRSMEARS